MEDELAGLKLNFDNSYVKLPAGLFTKTKPEIVAAPRLVLWNSELAKELGLSTESVTNDQLAACFSGNAIPQGAEPIAQAYAGHQFGHFNVLGDGRAILLGEHITASGDRKDIQLKGSGRTSYSRRGDGRATLYSMLREYLISESMHGLGISSTRSLSVVANGEEVWREKVQEGGVLCRVAISHVRVGTFEFVRRNQSVAELKFFTDYVINRHYPELKELENPFLGLLQRVIKEQITTVTNWFRVGFIHGVMNTDNTSISGETIDYGPCAFMNTYYPKTVFSSIDTNGRYAFGNQDNVLWWNIARFAECLLPIIDDNQEESLVKAQEEIEKFPLLFKESYLKMMRLKLGVLTPEAPIEKIVSEVLNYFEQSKKDYTNGFLLVGDYVKFKNSTTDSILSKNEQLEIETNLPLWTKQLDFENLEFSSQTMSENNPQYIPRNYLVEKALLFASEHDDYELFNEMLSIMKNPYSWQSDKEAFQLPPENGDVGYKTFCGT